MRKHTIKSSIFDELHYYANEYSDHCMRTEIQFDGELDKDVLIQAFNKSIDLVPIIKSKWVTGRFNNYWEVIEDFDIKDYLTITDDFETAENFIVDRIDFKAGAQIKVLLYKHDGKDSMRILTNHALFDAASLKDFYRLLSKYYSGLKQNSEFVVTDFINGDRQLWQLFNNFSFKQRLKFIFKKNPKIIFGDKMSLPYEKGVSATEKVLLKNFYDEHFFLKLKDKSKKVGVTLNDIFLAAYGRTIFDLCPDNDLPLVIECAYDLRKYIKGGKTAGLTNMVGSIILPFKKIEGENFDETVTRVSRLMNKYKSDYPGMHKLELLRLVSLALKVPSLRKIITKESLGNSMTGLSNLGILTEDMANYTGLNVEDFYMTGALKYPPYTFLSLISFRNHLYISSMMYESKKDVEIEKRKLDLVRSYLESYIE